MKRHTHMLSFTFLPFTSSLCTWKCGISIQEVKKTTTQAVATEMRTRKSTPIVALLSSSGSHCSSENRSSKLLLPTEELPISKSLQLIGAGGLGAGAMLSLR